MWSQLVFLFLCGTAFAQKDPHFEPGRNTIVHLFEWKWSDIADECERFLQPKGYAGVQISPPNENLIIQPRPWWERYQPISYKLVTRSGDENAFADMVRRCRAVGVNIYVDGVINHMTADSGMGTGGSTADRPNKDFPAVPYSYEHFHESCPLYNWQDEEVVRDCELNALADLNQGLDYVREQLIDYMNHLIELGVAGFRIDAAKLMLPEDLEVIYNGLRDLNTDLGFQAGARAFIYQEVSDLGGEPITANDYVGIAAVLEFKYGVYLGNVFQGGDKLTYLNNWGTGWGLLDSGDAVAFIDNHDNQRSGGAQILTYKNSKPYKMAIAFMLAYPYGTTRIISSYYFDDNDQGPPQDADQNLISPSINPDNTCGNGYVCEHRWREIYNMVVFKNVVAGTEIENWWSNGDQQIAFGRGNKGFVAFTIDGDLNQHLNTGLPAGTYCDVVSGDLENNACTGKFITVGEDGYADVYVGIEEFDGVVAYHVDARVM